MSLTSLKIVHVAQSNDSVHVYVTDFTRNDRGLGLRPVRTDWCPATLASKTLQIEFFGPEAANFVRDEEMSKGQLWSLCNVRLKRGRGDQYLEGSFSEVRKAHRLEEEGIDHPYLRDLLVYVIHTRQHLRPLTSHRRRKQFEDSNNGPYEFQHNTVAEAEIPLKYVVWCIDDA